MLVQVVAQQATIRLGIFSLVNENFELEIGFVLSAFIKWTRQQNQSVL